MISENKFIICYRGLRGTNFKRNSWIYQKLNLDLFYRQINITIVKGPFADKIIITHLLLFRTLLEIYVCISLTIVD